LVGVEEKYFRSMLVERKMVKLFTDVIMLTYHGRYIAIQGQNEGDDTSIDFCPELLLQLISVMEYAPEMFSVSIGSHEDKMSILE